MMRKTEGVQIAAAFTSEYLRPGRKILDRGTSGVKLDRNVIVMS
jgi:hypothetical protein